MPPKQCRQGASLRAVAAAAAAYLRDSTAGEDIAMLGVPPRGRRYRWVGVLHHLVHAGPAERRSKPGRALGVAARFIAPYSLVVSVVLAHHVAGACPSPRPGAAGACEKPLHERSRVRWAAPRQGAGHGLGGAQDQIPGQARHRVERQATHRHGSFAQIIVTTRRGGTERARRKDYYTAVCAGLAHPVNWKCDSLSIRLK
jgi:hypothetical protein